MAASPRPGVTGTLSIGNGGTGATSAADAWTNLGGGSIGKKDSLAASDIPNISTDKLTSGTLGVARGGTGRSTITQYAVMVGAGTSSVALISAASGAFYATSSTANPTFGTLPVAQGGTGLTSSPSLLVNLASTTASNVMAASPRPGVTGQLPIANGGTGAATAAAARSALETHRILYGTSAPTASLGEVGDLYVIYTT